MSSPVNVGDIVGGKYQVERVLGVGGMAVVAAAGIVIWATTPSRTFATQVGVGPTGASLRGTF